MQLKLTFNLEVCVIAAKFKQIAAWTDCFSAELTQTICLDDAIT